MRTALAYVDTMKRSAGLYVHSASLIVAIFLSTACQAPAETLEVINWNTYHLFDHKAKLEEATRSSPRRQPQDYRGEQNDGDGENHHHHSVRL